jgi:hypothetical protein
MHYYSSNKEEINLRYNKTFFQNLFKCQETVEWWRFYPSSIKHLAEDRRFGVWMNMVTGKEVCRSNTKFQFLEEIRDAFLIKVSYPK